MGTMALERSLLRQPHGEDGSQSVHLYSPQHGSKTMNKHTKGGGLRNDVYNVRVHKLAQPHTESIRVQLGISDDSHASLQIWGTKPQAPDTRRLCCTGL